ncbi:MAG: hypothetical protein V1851_03250 [Patescibacteria group bacterium]
MSNKITTVLCLLGVIIFILFFLFKGCDSKEERQKKLDKEKEKQEEIQNQPVWVYCITDPAEKIKPCCGKVIKLNFNSDGSMSFKVYNEKRKITVDFWRGPKNEFGEYSQPGETGTWFLKEVSPDVFEGWVKDDKGVTVLHTLQKTLPLN